MGKGRPLLQLNEYWYFTLGEKSKEALFLKRNQTNAYSFGDFDATK